MRWDVAEAALGAVMAVLLLVVGGYLTWKLRAVQLRRFCRAFDSVRGGRGRGISAFSAACTNLGATVGVGNIFGVAAGIAVGGPGTLLWMLIAAFFGMAIRWFENVLGSRSRVAAESGYGGPFFYIERCLPRIGKPAARIYAVLCVTGSLFGMGVMLQSGCIRSVWSAWTGESPTALVMTALLLLILTAPVLLGGAKRIADAASRIVPVMTGGYLLCCCWILHRFRADLPRVIGEIFSSAFGVRAIGGAALGTLLRETVLSGVQRGLFSNEAGLGLGAITAASVEENDAERMGDLGLFVTFLDTFVICLASGLCILVTRSEGDGSLLLQGWREGIPWAGELAPAALSLFLTLFALTSIYGVGFGAESALRYLGRVKWLNGYRLVSAAAVVVGYFLPQELFWHTADALNAALAILNLPALFFAAKGESSS